MRKVRIGVRDEGFFPETGPPEPLLPNTRISYEPLGQTTASSGSNSVFDRCYPQTPFNFQNKECTIEEQESDNT